ncbi:MAG: HNH endonuclease signature motif containing protein [Nitrosopumilus sp.]
MRKMSGEVREKISKFRKGKTYVELYGEERANEIKNKISKGSKGKKKPEGYGKKISKVLTGKKRSVKAIKKTIESRRNNGKPWHSEEMINKLRGLFGGETNKGKNNPNWKGGLSRLPYPFDFNEKLKNLIRERDGHICQLCFKTKEENGKRLSVHHIDYIKENLDPENLTTLCSSCNSKVNKSRKSWTKFFHLKLRLRIS